MDAPEAQVVFAFFLGGFFAARHLGSPIHLGFNRSRYAGVLEGKAPGTLVVMRLRTTETYLDRETKMSKKERDLSEGQAVTTPSPDEGCARNQDLEPKNERKRASEGVVELPRPKAGA